jgi:hypothetical protein
VSRGRPKNVAASARQRLLELARRGGEDFQWLLTRHAIERLLHRLSRSGHAADFVLKGAQLFALWIDSPHRPTKDLDLLGFGECSEVRLRRVFAEVCAAVVEPDGWEFDAGTITVEEIREDQEYPGLRVCLAATLDRAEIKVQVDVGFGDAVTPAPVEVEYPTLLEGPAPILRAYPRETTVAEKLEAAVKLGIANSRMKDFHDLWELSRRFDFDGPVLVMAIRATFARRGTALPSGAPIALTAEFADDRQKQAQWKAYITRNFAGATDAPTLGDVVAALARFLGPPLAAAPGGDFAASWPRGGPWSPTA